MRDFSEYTLHSGGATGADASWHILGAPYGLRNCNHYLLSKDTEVADERLRALGVKPVHLSAEDEIEGQQKVTIAARQMGRIEPTHQVRDSKLIRNWAQIKYADTIYAITTMLSVGTVMNYGKKALIRQGKGGTGYAIQMAINEGKTVYVYDQERNQWFTNRGGVWFICNDIPIITSKNFAGIGTRDINQKGLEAIHAVYQLTLAFN